MNLDELQRQEQLLDSSVTHAATAEANTGADVLVDVSAAASVASLDGLPGVYVRLTEEATNDLLEKMGELRERLHRKPLI